MDFEKYKYHYALLSYRNELATSRLRSLQSDISQPSMFFSGFTRLFRIYIEKLDTVPDAVRDFEREIQHIYEEFQSLFDKTRQNVQTELEAQEILDEYWKHFWLIELLMKLPEKMLGLLNELRPVIPEFDRFVSWLSESAIHFWADIDVFANPGELKIPEFIPEWRQFREQIYNTQGYGRLEFLPTIIDAAQKPLSAIRGEAAVLLRHYQDDQAVDMLVHLLFDPFDPVRGQAADSLGHIKNVRAVPALAQAIQQDFKEEAYIGWIGEALAAMPDEQAVEALAKVLDRLMAKSPDPQEFLWYPLAGVYKALKAINTPSANAALDQYSLRADESKPEK